MFFARSLSLLAVSLAIILPSIHVLVDAQGVDLTKRDGRAIHSPPLGFHNPAGRRSFVLGTHQANPNVASRASGLRRDPGSFGGRPDWRRNNGIEKRASNARFTLYTAGLGACGATNSNSDAIVAMSAQDWAGGSHCFDKVTIAYKGKSVQATIVDRCVECPSGALDLTPSLFAQFENPDAGVIYGSWVYGGGSPPPEPKPEVKPEPKPEPKPSPTPSPTPKPSSSSAEPSSTSTHEAPSTTSTRPSSTSITASSTASAVATSAPAATISPNDPQVINQVNVVLLYLGELAVAGAQATV